MAHLYIAWIPSDAHTHLSTRPRRSAATHRPGVCVPLQHHVAPGLDAYQCKVRVAVPLERNSRTCTNPAEYLCQQSAARIGRNVLKHLHCVSVAKHDAHPWARVRTQALEARQSVAKLAPLPRKLTAKSRIPHAVHSGYFSHDKELNCIHRLCSGLASFADFVTQDCRTVQECLNLDSIVLGLSIRIAASHNAFHITYKRLACFI